MPQVYERVSGRIVDRITIPAGNSMDRFTFDHTRQYGFFIVQRLWMEILEASTDDLAKIKKHCVVRLVLGFKTYLDSPASALLLEDWLRKAIRKIAKGRHRKIERYIDHALRRSLAGLEPLDIHPGEIFFLEVGVVAPFTFSSNFDCRFHLVGEEFRPIQ